MPYGFNSLVFVDPLNGNPSETITVDGQSGSTECDSLHNVFPSLRKWSIVSDLITGFEKWLKCTANGLNRQNRLSGFGRVIFTHRGGHACLVSNHRRLDVITFL
jgi:hypothetical protein